MARRPLIVASPIEAKVGRRREHRQARSVSEMSAARPGGGSGGLDGGVLARPTAPSARALPYRRPHPGRGERRTFTGQPAHVATSPASERARSCGMLGATSALSALTGAGEASLFATRRHASSARDASGTRVGWPPDVGDRATPRARASSSPHSNEKGGRLGRRDSRLSQARASATRRRSGQPVRRAMRARVSNSVPSGLGVNPAADHGPSLCARSGRRLRCSAYRSAGRARTRKASQHAAVFQLATLHRRLRAATPGRRRGGTGLGTSARSPSSHRSRSSTRMRVDVERHRGARPPRRGPGRVAPGFAPRPGWRHPVAERSPRAAMRSYPR